MPAVFSTTQTFTSGQKNVGHTHLNAIVSGLSVANIGASAGEIADDGVKAQHINADTAGAGLEQDANGALQILGAGYRTLALTNANVTLVRGTDKRNQEFGGTLTGAVVINLSRASAVAGDPFDIHLNAVITTPTFTLTIQENGTGALRTFNLSKSLTGLIMARYDGSAWKLTLVSVTQV